jgi:site-specific DNA recombinase
VTRRLAPVPDTAPRVLGLIRVSKERDGMIAPEVQRAAIEDYCRARGYEIRGWREGLDESGSRARSAWWPRLEQAIASVEAGEYDVIVVWKYSRVARQRLRWATAIDRVEQAGGRLESATEQVDVTTSTGRFTRGMLAELQAFEAERIGEVWKEVHARRVNAGRPASGKPKFGYAYDPELKLHVPDPVTGPVLGQVYRRYTAGESVYSLVRWLNTHEHPTLTGGLWSDRSLRRVMDSGFAAGLFMSGGDLHQGVHEPLLTPGEWQAFQDARARRRQSAPRRERSQYLLSGLVRCARCGHPMVAGQFGNHRQPKYRCKVGKEQGATGCQGGYVTARFVEAAVLAWVGTLAADVDVAKEAARESVAHHAIARADATRLARALAKAEEALTRFAVQNAQAPLPPAVYRASYTELTDTVVRLQEQLEEAQRDAREGKVNPRRAARALLDGWQTKPVAMRRAELSEMIEAVLVTTGRPRGTVEIRPRWSL